MEFKSLKKKDEFKYEKPSADILEVFKNPGVIKVSLISSEFTSLCPITGQPDYAQIGINCITKDLCIESKSLKLYLNAYRNEKGFAEQICSRIARDVSSVIKSKVIVRAVFRSRGGIEIRVEVDSDEISNQ